MVTGTSSALSRAGRRRFARLRPRNHDGRRCYRPGRYQHALHANRAGDSSFSFGGNAAAVPAGLRRYCALAVARPGNRRHRRGSGMMAVVTDRGVLERIAAIVQSAKPVERPIIPERVAAPARGSARRTIAAGRTSGAGAGNNAPAPSGEAYEQAEASGREAGSERDRDARKGAGREATARRNAGGAVGRAADQAELDTRLAFFPL